MYMWIQISARLTNKMYKVVNEGYTENYRGSVEQVTFSKVSKSDEINLV